MTFVAYRRSEIDYDPLTGDLLDPDGDFIPVWTIEVAPAWYLFSHPDLFIAWMLIL